MSWTGVHESPRGEAIPEFGPDVTAAFCAANEISCIVRSHQFVRQGYKVMHAGRLLTLFSARNYFRADDGVSNDAAMLLLAPDLNGHLRFHPKRIAHTVSAHAAQDAPDWRLNLLRGIARCLAVKPSSMRE